MGRPIGSNYVTEVEIGHGGYGTVWRALDRRSGEQVAIKILNPQHTSDQDVVSRFLRERSALLRLRHPNLVRLRDVVFEGDTLALVMDLVDGPTLDQHLRSRGPLPAAEVAGLIAQVAEALVVVHAAGVIHRDIKPSNILLAPLAADPDARTAVFSVAGGGAWPQRPTSEAAMGGLCPRLADFGIALLTDGSQVTKSNELVGTLAYLAPEALRGDPSSSAVDVYALGIVAYQLLSGQPPFDGDTQYAVVRRHLYEVPTPLRGVPDRLWSIVAACLAKEPHERPPVGQVGVRLRSLAEDLGAPVPSGWGGAVPPSYGPMAGRTVLLPADAHRAALAAAGIDGQAATVAVAPAVLAPTAPAARAGQAAPTAVASPTRQYTRRFTEEDVTPAPGRGGPSAGQGYAAPPVQAPPPTRIAPSEFGPRPGPGPQQYAPGYPQGWQGGPPAPGYPPPYARPPQAPPSAPERPARRPGPRIRWWRVPFSGCLLRIAILVVLALVVWYVLGGEQAWHSINSWWHSVQNWWHSTQRLYHDISSLKLF